MKYIIRWNAGYGNSYEEVEAKDENEAQMMAYDAWKEEAENCASYDVIGVATDKLREDYL